MILRRAERESDKEITAAALRQIERAIPKSLVFSIAPG